MNIFRINNKYVAVAIFLMLAVTLQAQDYGALQYMLQKRPANEKFESNRFNEHLFFSAGPYSGREKEMFIEFIALELFICRPFL